MKGPWFFRQFRLLGIALFLLLAGSGVSRAQTGPVGPPTPALTVSIIAPTNGEAFPLGSAVLITATAKDATGFINTMFFYAGSNLLAGRVIDPPVPLPTNDTITLSYDWTNVPPGEYTLTVVAGDNHGFSTTSAPVDITVGLKSVPIVSIIATDPIAVEPGTNHIIFQPLALTATAYPSFTNYCSGTNTATFLVRRISPLALPYGGPLIPPTNGLTVYYTIGGTASNGVDYVTLPGYVTIPAGKNFALITIHPLEDIDPSNSPPLSTVILTLVPPPTLNPGSAEPYRIRWPDKAGAVILEENLFQIGPRPPIGPCGPPIAGTPFPPFHVCFPATNGMPYCIEVSSNLTSWTPVCTNLVVKNSIQFVDPDACTNPNCFYRVARPAAVPLY